MKAVDSLLEPVLNNSGSRYVLKVGRRWSPVLEGVVLIMICLVAFFIRLFAVIRFESVIHEFDPYFNFRTSRFLSREGYYEFWNWFDEGSWYPLGRVIGQTLFPGLMTSAYAVFNVFHFFGIMIDIKDVCVFLAPMFSGCTALAAFLFTREVSGTSEAGLFGALFAAIVPSYLSRSVAGSYDNEGVAIFALIFSFYVFIKAIHSGTALWGMLAALAYFYMVAAWGGYVFVTNTISIYMVVMVLLGRVKGKHFVAFATWYIIGTMLCLNIPFVNFQAIHSSEHMASHGVFMVLLAITVAKQLNQFVPRSTIQLIMRLLVGTTTLGFVIVFTILTLTGGTSWTGRSMTLLDPGYAAKHIPIIASVSEHQPTTWSSYILDLHVLVVLAPVGLWIAFRRLTDGLIFVGIYGLLSVYFSGVMIRLMLVLAPASAVLGAVGLSYLVSLLVSLLRPAQSLDRDRNSLAATRSKGGSTVASFIPRNHGGGYRMNRFLAITMAATLMLFCVKFVAHSTWASSMAYSHPSIVQASKMQDGTRVIQDDFREAYYWLRKNTADNARIMSWWDYGYQITAMGNRTVLVDNNTWNNTHIATVGLAMSSSQEESYHILRRHDVDYVLVVFGGLARYSSDDINKFLWMVRIASGVYPHIRERDYISADGHGYTIGKHASPTMLNSLMYAISFYRLAEVTGGRDYVRGIEMGKLDVKLKHIEEAFTSEHWIVRIYKVLKPSNRGEKAKPGSSSTSLSPY